MLKDNASAPRNKAKEENLGKYDSSNTLNDLTGKEWIRFTKSWVICDGKPSDIPSEIQDHPASFPPDLIEEFVLFFTKKGETVLDPFLGIGSTLVACQRTERNGIGIEIVPKYAKYAMKRLHQKTLFQKTVQRVITGDAAKIDTFDLPTIDFVITSPPYWNILRTSRGGVKSVLKRRVEKGFDEIYSGYPEDLGNIDDYDVYLEKLCEIFAKIYSLLRNGRYLVIIIQNVRLPSGETTPLAWDIGKRLGQIYTLKQEKIWLQNQKFLGIWGYPHEYVSNVHHHYCLIFKKDKKVK